MLYLNMNCFYQILPLGASKGNGVKILLDELKVDP